MNLIIAIINSPPDSFLSFKNVKVIPSNHGPDRFPLLVIGFIICYLFVRLLIKMSFISLLKNLRTGSLSLT
jgi:hypothetical protein